MYFWLRNVSRFPTLFFPSRHVLLQDRKTIIVSLILQTWCNKQSEVTLISFLTSSFRHSQSRKKSESNEISRKVRISVVNRFFFSPLLLIIAGNSPAHLKWLVIRIKTVIFQYILRITKSYIRALSRPIWVVTKALFTHAYNRTITDSFCAGSTTITG